MGALGKPAPAFFQSVVQGAAGDLGIKGQLPYDLADGKGVSAEWCWGRERSGPLGLECCPPLSPEGIGAGSLGAGSLGAGRVPGVSGLRSLRRCAGSLGCSGCGGARRTIEHGGRQRCRGAACNLARFSLSKIILCRRLTVSISVTSASLRTLTTARARWPID